MYLHTTTASIMFCLEYRTVVINSYASHKYLVLEYYTSCISLSETLENIISMIRNI